MENIHENEIGVKSNTQTPSKVNLDLNHEENNKFINDTPNQEKNLNDIKSISNDYEQTTDKISSEVKKLDFQKNQNIEVSRENKDNYGEIANKHIKVGSIATEESKKLINKMKNLQKKAASKSNNTSNRLTFEMIENKIREDQHKQKILDKELKNLSCIRKEELGLIDEKASHEYFLKFKLEEFIGILIYIWSLFCSILYYETHLQTFSISPKNKNFYKAPLIMNTIFVIFSCKLLLIYIYFFKQAILQ